MNLSSQQLLNIRQLIEESPISRLDMRENLIDHICCAVENKIANGQCFDVALAASLEDLAPNGLKEIEMETFLMLNAKIITMKKFTYSAGLLFSISASFGSIFKVLHMPGANELTILGFGGLALVFAPFLILVRQKSWKSNVEKFREVFFLMSIILVAIGMTLKIFRLAGSEGTLLTGLVLFTLGFLPLAFLKMYREAVAV